jgi:DNA (cytosine-5)-methyltransferase 1
MAQAKRPSLYTHPLICHAQLDGIAQINRETGTKYEVTWQVINTADYGVPQIRERVFMIGSRDGRRFASPKPTHAKPEEIVPDLFGGLEPYRIAWDAIGGTPEPSNEEPSLKIGGKWGDLLPSIPEGEYYLWHTDRRRGEPLFGWRTRYWSFLLKLAKACQLHGRNNRSILIQDNRLLRGTSRPIS